jgi:hypothetical protein
MESLFDPQGNKNIIERIDNLTPIKLSEWGVMTVSQMLEHCQMPLKVVYGTLEIKVNWLMKLLFGRSAKKMFSGHKRFGKGLPTAKEFKITYEPDFETAKKELKELVSKFSRDGRKGIMVTSHPLFGKMTYDEIDYAQWKHLDHHLRQFGV